MKKVNKHTKIFLLGSISGVLISFIMGFLPRYNTLLFVLRQSFLYLGLALLVPMIISVFYPIYKRWLINKNSNLHFLNITTLLVLLTSLIFIADYRLDYIEENEVPLLVNVILYDDYNNLIYRSVINGETPSIELIEKTNNKLVLHIEEVYSGMQSAHDLEKLFPDRSFERKELVEAQIWSDVEISYNDDNSISEFIITESRLVKFILDGEDIYGFSSRQQDIKNTYLNFEFISVQKHSFYNVMFNESELSSFIVEGHHDFSSDQETVVEYRFEEDFQLDVVDYYTLSKQEEDKEYDEIAYIESSFDEFDNLYVEFIENTDRPLQNDYIYLYSTSELEGHILVTDNQVNYFYSRMVNWGTEELQEVNRNYNCEDGKYIISSSDSSLFPNETDNYPYYGNLFDDSSFVELVRRDEIIAVVNEIELFEIQDTDFGYMVLYHVYLNPQFTNNYQDTNNINQTLDIFRLNYFNYESMLFRYRMNDEVIYENNQVINFMNR
jgi:hypothetical protein